MRKVRAGRIYDAYGNVYQPEPPNSAKFLDRINLGTIGTVVGTIVGLVALGIAIESRNVSISAYQDAQESGQKQLEALDKSSKAIDLVVQKLKALDESADALREMVETAEKQQELLDASLKVSRAQLASNEQQWKEEQERLSRRGKISLRTGKVELIHGNQKTLPWIILARGEKRDRLPISFSMQNAGSAIGREVFFIAEIVTDANVNLSRAHLMNLSGTPKVLQVALGKPVLPYDESGISYGVDVEVLGQIPDAFALRIRVFGEGIETLSTSAGFLFSK